MINILVIGDIMLDKYVIGDVTRISPEAPVPIIKRNKVYSTPGGCGNVIRNLSSFNCNIYCKTIIGAGSNGSCIMHKLNELNNFHTDFIIKSLAYNTTVKERIISKHRFTQMLRIDIEMDSPEVLFSEEELNEIKELNINMIIISDYMKGVITLPIMDQVRNMGIPFIVDPKPANAGIYFGAYAITPNHVEFNQIKDLVGTYDFSSYKYVIHTLGSKGIEIIDIERNNETLIKTNPVEVFNVSGAGDTVISTIAFCIAKGNDMVTSCQIANECAHYVVTKPGTSIIPTEMFNDIYIEFGGI